MQCASGERALTPEAEQRSNMTRTIADARRDLIDFQNELQDLRLNSSFDDLESLQKKAQYYYKEVQGTLQEDQKRPFFPQRPD
jgi:hypothetical protein